MPKLTRDGWLEIAKVYAKKVNFPNCLGVIDGKHIRIRKPKNTGSEYFNYKNYFSVVLMAVVDVNYRFLVVDIGDYQRFGDSLIFKDSNFGQRLQRAELDLSLAWNIEGYKGPAFPFYIFSRRSFSLCDRIMRQFGGHNLTINQFNFNYRLSRGRQFVECAFGILANKYTLFHTPIALELVMGHRVFTRWIDKYWWYAKMSLKPKVLLINDNFPKKAIDLLRTRCDVEVLKHNNKNKGLITSQDIVNCVSGMFSIFCHSGIQINEQILKAAVESVDSNG
ncbi:hypothetical protein QTP88_024514 [Uroleucon formosanum]